MPFPNALKGFVVVVGWVMSIVINIALHAITAACRMRKRVTGLPRWLAAANLFVFVFQIIYIFIIP